jgi:hypothetical protein
MGGPRGFLSLGKNPADGPPCDYPTYIAFTALNVNPSVNSRFTSIIL